MIGPGVRRRLYSLLLSVWGGAILFFTLAPSPQEQAPLFPGWDKVEHALGFGGLAWLTGRFLIVYGKCVRRCWLWAFSAAVMYGALIEVAQATLTTSRKAEFGDLVADAVGAGLVCLIASRRDASGSKGAEG